MKRVSNRTVTLLLIATIIIAIGGTFFSLEAVNRGLSALGLAPITGFALAPNATATLTIAVTSSIKFIQANIDFGTGYVNASGGYNNCTLSTLPGVYGYNFGCEGFNEISNGFTVENDGNTNLSVELESNRTAAQFIEVGSALFKWNVTINETGSCVNISGSNRLVVEPNTTDAGCGGNPGTGASDCGTIFETVVTSYKNICPSLLYDDSSDALNIDINISIPVDAPTGAKIAGIVVRGTREPLT